MGKAIIIMIMGKAKGIIMGIIMVKWKWFMIMGLGMKMEIRGIIFRINNTIRILLLFRIISLIILIMTMNTITNWQT